MGNKTDIENLQRAALLYSKARSREHNSFMEYTRQHNVDYQKAEKARKRADMYSWLSAVLMGYISRYKGNQADELYGESGTYQDNPLSDDLVFVPERLTETYGIDWQGVYIYGMAGTKRNYQQRRIHGMKTCMITSDHIKLKSRDE